jgi:putative FmdB family regulatory protein
MPTYEYECGACGHRLEKFQSMTDRPIRKCPSCGRQKLQRLIGSGAGIIFKGSGFYETDYKRSGAASSSSNSEGSSGSSESGSSACEGCKQSESCKSSPSDTTSPAS